jgi:hypothetical protein
MRRALLLAAGLLLVAAPGAHAANRFTLDAHASKPGHVLISPPHFALGTVLVAWTSGNNDTPKVCAFRVGTGCANPQTLTLPAGGGIDGLFPVVTAENTVALIGPRDQQNDVVEWKASDGFATPDVIGGSYPALTNTQDVLVDANETWIGAANPGLGLGGFGAKTGNFEFSDPGPNVKTSSLAFGIDGRPVDAYYTLGGSLRVTRFAGDQRFDENSWTEPETIAPGTEPVLAGGIAGLFLASHDGTKIDLRRDDGDAFGAPITLDTDPNAEDFDGGAAAQAPDGRLAVVWPTHRANGTKVMREYVSTDAGATFTQSDIATVGDGYLVDRNASFGLANDGTGVVTFLDSGGLELADTTPLAAPAPPPPPPPVPVVPPKPPRCFNSKATAHLRGATVILRTTHVHAGDILAQVSVRSRHRLKLKVRFRYDGRTAHARTRLSALVHARPGTHHTLIARVSSRGRTRTLKLRLTGCAG